ncbi:hypothetical protein, partial [Escherichia coli]|uniref:hypothetical protein n=1 Tax=Escherichia coli TaxID=562 RepID=UPI001953E1F4
PLRSSIALAIGSGNNDELKKQAINNGYYLIKQRKYHWSLCFFILSRSYDEIANICSSSCSSK